MDNFNTFIETPTPSADSHPDLEGGPNRPDLKPADLIGHICSAMDRYPGGPQQYFQDLMRTSPNKYADMVKHMLPQTLNTQSDITIQLIERFPTKLPSPPSKLPSPTPKLPIEETQNDF